jgi:hypothetical protein
VRRVFKTRTFTRWSKKVGVSDGVLLKCVEEMTAGLIDAELGGRVYKKRIPLPGRGKSGGARTLIGTDLGNRWFFLFGFGKNERTNIDGRELAALQKIAEALLSLNVEQIDQAVQARELEEIDSEEKPATSGNA